MKKLVCSLTVILASCGSPYYYQVYKTTSAGGSAQNNKIAFENDQCKVMYDLWSHGGRMTYTVQNKTNDFITVDLTRSFFILNGEARPYFRNRQFSESSSSSVSRTYYYAGFYYGSTNSAGTKGSEITYAERPEAIVPPGASIKLAEYEIVRDYYNHCGLNKTPSRKNPVIAAFIESNSPFVVTNHLTLIRKKDTIGVRHKFFVSEISNVPPASLNESVVKDPCGRPYPNVQNRIRQGPPEQFYFKYQLTSPN